jgi:hypothetical protein
MENKDGFARLVSDSTNDDDDGEVSTNDKPTTIHNFEGEFSGRKLPEFSSQIALKEPV